MQNVYKKIFSLTVLLSATVLQASNDCCCDVSPTYIPRSQGRDKTRQVIGTVGKTHLKDMDTWYGIFSVLFEYTRSFRPKDIARSLFGCSLDNCDCPSIKIQGCNVTDRDSKAWLADYFYLPSDFNSSITFEPRIENFLVDFDFYIGLDEWFEGTYFRIYGPVTHTRWDLNFCECGVSAGTQAHPQGYFATQEIDRDKLLADFTSYACGAAPAPIDDLTSTLNDITFQPLKNAKLDKCRRTHTGFADLRFELGWNFWLEEDYHLGINVQGAAPTGNRHRACYAFNPLVGNGNHWEFGGGLTGHYVFWRNEDNEKHAGFYFDANVTHLLKARQCRTFDLCGKPNSRYMLAAKMTDNVVGTLAGINFQSDIIAASSTTPAFSQFAKEYAPVANISTLETKVSVGAQGDVVAMFNVTVRRFSWDFGYNFWGRSCERIECPEICPNDCEKSCICPNLCDSDQERKWVLKGNAHVFGFMNSDGANFAKDDPIALSPSQSKATICNGTNTATKKEKNLSVDRAQFAYGDVTDPDKIALLTKQGAGFSEATHIKTSIQPVFLKCSDLNFQKTRAQSHKVFTHFSYTWDREDWTPYLGVGGFAEFGKRKHNNNNCSTACDSCTTGANSGCATTRNTSCCDDCDPCPCRCIQLPFSQWGVWIKGGVEFGSSELSGE